MNKKITGFFEYARILAAVKSSDVDDPSTWSNSLTDPTSFYLDCFRYFYFRLPAPLRNHKRYFTKSSRGFGEKAFHTMWYLLFGKYKFENFLEIGIYRGQTISLVALLTKLQHREISVYGISPFDDSADEVSKYMRIDYLADVLNNFKYFSLQVPNLIKAFSTDPAAINIIESKQWDCIYIDGSHDYNIALMDWNICSQNVKKGGIIVMDDASLYTDFNPPFFAFKGHPGPSRVADAILSNSDFREVVRVGHNRVFERIN